MVINFLQNIDFISPNITLFYEGKKRFPTMIGGIITIIICFVAIISFSNQLISYLNYEVNENIVLVNYKNIHRKMVHLAR